MSSLHLLFLFMTVCKLSQAAYVAEGYFVVDRKALEIYINERTESNAAIRKQKAQEEMTEDINYILTEVNKLYQSFSPRGLDIEIRVKKVEFLDGNVFDSSMVYNEAEVDRDDALDVFDQWMATTGAYANIKFDFTVLWTGYNIEGKTLGIAHMGKVCDSELATSVVEWTATYRTADITAHEIGHILGSSHDGAASSMVMAAAGSAEDADRWSFSMCSTTDIIDYIATLDQNCLLDTSAQSTKPNSTMDTYGGQLLDPDVICKRTLNDTESYMCHSSNLYDDEVPHGDKVCGYIYCAVPDSRSCRASYTSEGLICDSHKRCSGGKCVTDPTPHSQAVDPLCIWGDVKLLNFTSPVFAGTCTEYLAKYGVNSCYGKWISELCCATCKTHNTGVPGCEYGNTNDDCVNYTPESICHSQDNRKQCCQTCKGFSSRRSARVVQAGHIQLIPQEKLVVMDVQIDSEGGNEIYDTAF